MECYYVGSRERNTAILEKLVAVQMAKKLPAVYRGQSSTKASQHNTNGHYSETGGSSPHLIPYFFILHFCTMHLNLPMYSKSSIPFRGTKTLKIISYVMGCWDTYFDLNGNGYIHTPSF
jgi:hypothetical protein